MPCKCPCRPVGCVPAIPAFFRPVGGYVFIESLTALIVVSVGMLPLAALWPVGMHGLRQQQAVAHGTRVAAEVAEIADAMAGALSGPAMPLLAAPAAGIAWRLQQASCPVPSAGCAGSARLALAGPLAAGADADGAAGAALPWIALWVAP